jgi:glycosyltransferase involved in cell wall biosynthesis
MAIRAFEYLAIHASSCVVSVARQHQEHLQTEYGKNIYYVPNGVNIGQKIVPHAILNLGLLPDNYILYVGRLSPEKGCHFLLNAFKHLKTKQHLVIAGDAPHNQDYIRSLKDNADDRVLFLGHVSSDLLYELYSNASIYVLPSESEGLSISLLEAMSYGCCVVTSDIKENLDVILDCGLFFEFGNVDALSKTLNSLLQDYPLRKSMGQKAREHVARHYNWDTICTKYEELYNKLAYDKKSNQGLRNC